MTKYIDETMKNSATPLRTKELVIHELHHVITQGVITLFVINKECIHIPKAALVFTA